MADTTRAELLLEISRAARRLGAKSDLLGWIGSWEGTQSDEDVLDALQKWNRAHLTRPDEPVELSAEEAAKINAALALLPSALRGRAGPSGPLDAAIQKEIRQAFKWLGAPIELAAVLSSWGDTYDDAATLADLRRINESGSTFDSVTHDLGVLGQDNEPNGPKV